MAKYSAIKAAVDAYIKQNGRKEITGRILNAVLNAAIETLGKYFQFVGCATPETEIGEIDQNVAYISGTPGIYENLGGFTIDPGEICIFKYDGEWKKEIIVIIPIKVSQLENDLGFITNSVADLLHYYSKEETFNRDEVVSMLASYYDKDEIDSIVSAISGSAYVLSWGGSAEPVVENIPAGVVVTWNGEQYVGTLSADSETGGKIYLVKNGEDYDMYVTALDSGFTWVFIGTTAINLSEYATIAQVDRLVVDLGNLGAYVSPVMETYSRKVAVDIEGLSLRNYSIETDNTYGTSSAYKNSLIGIEPGNVARVTSPIGVMTRFCFVKSTRIPKNSEEE